MGAAAPLTRVGSPGLVRGADAREAESARGQAEVTQHNAIGALAAPIGWALRGAWQLGSSILRRFA